MSEREAPSAGLVLRVPDLASVAAGGRGRSRANAHFAGASAGFFGAAGCTESARASE